MNEKEYDRAKNLESDTNFYCRANYNIHTVNCLHIYIYILLRLNLICLILINEHSGDLSH